MAYSKLLPQHRLAPHRVPLLLLLTFALGAAIFSWNVGYEYRWTSDTTDTFYRIVSTLPAGAIGNGDRLLPTLVSGVLDVIVEQAVGEWYHASFDAYLRSFALVFGDISLAYKAMVFPFSVLFSVSAYFFFCWLTGNRWLALALAFAALFPMPLAWAGERSGLGPIWTYTRRYFLTAWLPLLGFLYFRAMLDRRRRISLVMACVGLASNLHASGIILLEILVLAWLVIDGVTIKRLFDGALLMGVGLCCSVASLASIWKAGLGAMTQLMLAMVSNDAVAAELMVLDKARLAVPEVAYLFYPPKMYAHLPSGLVAVWLALTIALSCWPLVQSARQKTASSLSLFAAATACLLFISFEQMWAWVLVSGVLYAVARHDERPRAYALAAYLIICTFWVAVGGMLLFQFGYGLVDGFPLVFNQLRGIRFIGFWVFVWLAVLAAPVASTLIRPALQPRLLLLAMALALIAGAHNFYRGYFRGLESDRLERKIALLDLANWAKKNSAPDSVFLLGYSAFGIRAERRITHPDKVVRNDGIDWLPPKGLKGPAESLAQAQRFRATHLFLDPADLMPDMQRCVKVGNSIYVIAETACLEALPWPVEASTGAESASLPP